MFSKIEKGVFLEDIKMSFMAGLCESIGRQGIACYTNTSMSEFGGVGRLVRWEFGLNSKHGNDVPGN